MINIFICKASSKRSSVGGPQFREEAQLLTMACEWEYPYGHSIPTHTHTNTHTPSVLLSRGYIEWATECNFCHSAGRSRFAFSA